MQDDANFWQAVGINITAAMGGLAGGIVGAWVDGKSGVKAWLAYFAAGGLTAGYLGEWAAHFVPSLNPSGAGFLVGGSAMFLIRLMRGVITRYALGLPGTETDDRK